jgi:hypothetical protein
MKLSVRHRSTLTFLALLPALCALPGRSFAMASVGDVSKERAKELGITVRSQPSANHDLWVQVEFKTIGAMKEFKWADLEVMQGGKRLVTAALLPRKRTLESPPESKMLEFYIDPAALADTTVTIFVYNVPLSGIGYRLKMKEFLARAASR